MKANSVQKIDELTSCEYFCTLLYKAEYSAFESTLNSPIVKLSYRIDRNQFIRYSRYVDMADQSVAYSECVKGGPRGSGGGSPQ